MSKLYVSLPCYNEEQNIGILIDQWIGQKDELASKGVDLIVCPIDDCSTDNTKAVMLSKQEQYTGSLVSPVFHEVNKNLRGGLNTSIEQFLKIGKDGDLMCLMDGDATHDPKYIQSMYDLLQEKNLDCVIASRYQPGANVVGLKFHRKMMSDFAKIYYSMVLKVPGVKDYTCGYRIYRLSAIEKLVEKFGHEPIKEQSFACMMEFLYKLHLCGISFGEVGFELRYDKKQGASKMNVFKTMKNSLFCAPKFKKLKKTM